MNAPRLAFRALLLAVLFSLLASVVLAQSGGGYDLTWNTIDGGGTTWSEGGGYSLGGTIGQADAGGSPAGGTPWPAASGAARRRGTASTCRWCCGTIHSKS